MAKKKTRGRTPSRATAAARKTRRPAAATATSAAPESSGRDFVALALEYARTAVSEAGLKKHGRYMRLAAQRFLDDMARVEQPGCLFGFDEWHARDACDFIEKLPHVEGVWDAPLIRLDPSDIFFVVNLFGFRKPDGTRRFTTALKATARKNAKSTIAAAIGLYCETCEVEQGPVVLSAATTGDQARVIFNIAKRMVDKTRDLREAFTLRTYANAIACYSNGGTFKPINAKASTQDGLNPSAVLLDEIHAHQTSDLLNVLRSAAGARRAPLFLYTTTEGYENHGPWGDLRTFAHQVLERVLEADFFFVVYHAVDDEDDDFDESTWIKSNPLLASNTLLLTELRKEAIEAKAMPSRHAEFRTKRLNKRTASARGWVDLDRWRRCGGPVQLDELAGHPCWGAFDLASTRDMSAWRLLWLVDDVWYTWGRYWVPADAVHQRAQRGTVPYDGWVRGGFMQQTDGDVTDYAVIERDIAADNELFKPQQVAYDDWNATDLANRLVARGLPLVKFIQGPRSYNPAMNALERAYINGKLRHGDNPVLTWNAANLVARTDANMNKAPDKKRSAEKIDGIVALLMCFGIAASRATEAESAAPTLMFV